MEKIKLVEEDIFDVKLIKSGIAYTSGERKANGETYTRFRYDGIVFTVPDTDPFVKDWIDGEVAIVKLLKGSRKITDGEGVETTVDSVDFDSHVNSIQLMGVKTRSAKIRVLEATVSAKEAMSMVDLESLLSGKG